MPPAKRLKSSNDTSRPALSRSDTETDGEFASVARQHWLKITKRASKVKVKNDVLKREIWDALEKDGFQFKSLVALEGLQTLESYLWPGYSEESSNFHVLLIVLLINVKRRERLDTWDLFTDRPVEFSGLFRRVLSMSLDSSLSWSIRTHILLFIIHAFQSLDCSIVRKECASLVSISVWHNLSTDKKRDQLLETQPHLRKAWKASAKRYDAADEETKARLRFERSWLYTLVLDYLNSLYSDNVKEEQMLYCERFVEFLADLQSQLPTRRYINTLLQDLHLLPAITLSPLFNDEDSDLLRDLYNLLAHYTHFTIDDQTGVQYNRTEAYDQHCARLAKLQRTALRHFKDKLTVLALSNYASIDQRDELAALLEPLTNEELKQLVELLDLRTSYPETSKLVLDRSFLEEIVLSTFEKRGTFQETAQSLSVLPDEESLFDNSLMRTDNYDGTRPLALPKLNLQYLSVGDFLWRSLVLYRCESFYGIRRDVEDVIRRLQPSSRKSGETSFSGFSKMALTISKPSILEVIPPLVGDDKPSMVRAEVAIDVRKCSDSIRREWDSLRPGDVVFLLAVDASKGKSASNGSRAQTEAQQMGLAAVRSAEVIHIVDQKGGAIKDAQAYYDGRNQSPTRRIQLKLDAVKYKEDTEKSASGKPSVYDGINVIVRRSGRENNFKPVLESIRDLALSDIPLASWLHEVFLGYGDRPGQLLSDYPIGRGRSTTGIRSWTGSI